MTNPQKAKGDAAEREIAKLLDDLLGTGVRRKLGAGRTDDTGDLDGLPNCTAQVKNYTDVLRAIREGLAAEIDGYKEWLHGNGFDWEEIRGG